MSLSPESVIRSDSPMDTSFECSERWNTPSYSIRTVSSPSIRSLASPSIPSIASPATHHTSSLRNISSPSMDSMFVHRHHSSTPIDDEDDRIVLEEVPVMFTPPSSQDRSSSQMSNLSTQSSLTPSNIFCVSPPLLMDNQLPATLKPSLPLEEELYSASDLFDSPPGGHVRQNSSNVFDPSSESFIMNLLNDEDLRQLRFDAAELF